MIASLCPAALTPARFARRAANPDKKIISARRAQVRPVRSVSRVVTPRAAMCPNPNLGDMSKLPGDPSVVVHARSRSFGRSFGRSFDRSFIRSTARRRFESNRIEIDPRRDGNWTSIDGSIARDRDVGILGRSRDARETNR